MSELSFETNLENSRRFYVESQSVARHPWGTAFKNCRKDLVYKAENSTAYCERSSLMRLAAFALLALLATAALGAVVYFVGRSGGVAVICGIVVFLLLWIARWLYYRRLGMNLYVARERIEIYLARWPNIVDLIHETPDGVIPPEPMSTMPIETVRLDLTAREDSEREFDAEMERAVGEMVAKMMPDAKVEVAAQKATEVEVEPGTQVEPAAEAKPEEVPVVPPQPIAEAEPERQKPKSSRSRPKSKPSVKKPKIVKEPILEPEKTPGPVQSDFDKILAEALLELDKAKQDLADMDQKIQTLGL